MLIGKFFKGLVALFLLTTLAFADAVTTSALSNGGAVSRDRELGEIREILRNGRGGYIDLGFMYTPLETQLPLKSEYGEHEGFAFKHHFAAFASADVTDNLNMGFLLWFERSGWDNEDFFFFPQYGDFALQRSTTTWGFSLTEARSAWTVALGMQHSNVEKVGNVYADESDSLAYSWAFLRWKGLSLQGSAYRTDWRSVHASLNLESKAVNGGASSGFATYLPNVDVALYNGDDDDSLRITWEQNLYAQKLYGIVSFDVPDGGFHSATLKFYPDLSRMVAFEASCLRRGVRSGAKDLLWGGAVDLLFLRLAYNSAYDYDHFFGAKGTFLAEIKFSLATLDGFLFGRGAAASAPLETSVVKQKNKDKPPERGMIPLGGTSSSGSPKTLEATGVRFENSTNGQGGF